ncbi:DUF771 domain-containing protein [Oceanobacillus kimchii]|uniref:DUF771 domain-containing protein n=1 Tax=Oceanobacillus kimchii TaxID=746691 RepID=UPI0021A82363|nr:DUF771 domain-containing protein [Oceanobacillus kimchii]MCT1575658.1 DUF771 domain-containing protein [Oceanobacillus kimchii]MCT2137289.1 DUF771 domain-containing protein [Oceanobacillus kimchii]
MQQLSVSIDIPIPNDQVIISKVELQELKEQSLSGVYWNMKDLEKRIHKSSPWIKENILYKPNFKRLLDIDNGGFVHYPKSQGQTWSFQASKMSKFLDDNFHKIYS